MNKDITRLGRTSAILVSTCAFLAVCASASCGRHGDIDPPAGSGVTATRGAIVTVGSWSSLTNLPPAPLDVMLLLTDGSVMAHKFVDAGSADWYRLTPDSNGGYANGTWSQLPSMHDTRFAFASAVLKDGRVFVAGGEYGTGKSTVEIYEPRTNTWTYVPGYNTSLSDIADSTAAALPDGRVLLLPRSAALGVVFDPSTGSWTPTAPKLFQDVNDEESVAKMPDGSLVEVDSARQMSQKFLPTTNGWVTTGRLPVALVDANLEIGPGTTLYDGRAFFLGATGKTAFYTPGANLMDPGTWQAGPPIPGGAVSSDAPAAVLPNGHVLFPVAATAIYEFDPATNAYGTAPSPPWNTAGINYMLLLPTGQVLMTNIYGIRLALYTPGSGASSAYQPTVSSITTTGNGRFALSGTQLNGFSEGATFGDDAQMATNFPLVRLTPRPGNPTGVHYARTYDFSSMGLATGAGSASFAVPGTPVGWYDVGVIANGVASASTSLQVFASAAQCNDGVKNGSETDKDCGGSCGPCAIGQLCSVSADCGSENCVAGVCTRFCLDSVKDRQETDVDCGGGCARCATGKACSVNTECASLLCTGGVCVDHCADHVKNADETDVDCGGTVCQPCVVGKRCRNYYDCQSQDCYFGSCTDHCTDAVLNFDESAVDCGGNSCATCPLGKVCYVNYDCASNYCLNGTCADHCHNLIKDVDESDVDCGGTSCGKCQLGKTCSVGGNCVSNYCLNGTCADHCHDLVKNVDETDVDCGGTYCTACASGKHCKLTSDCQSHVCNFQTCQ